MADAVTIEEIKNQLLKIADPLVFVDDEKTLDKYKCNNCNRVAITCLLANCNHLFYPECIVNMYKAPCPVCKNVDITEMTRDTDLENGILDLNVECKNKKNGCHEIISYSECKDHGKKCKFSSKALLPKVYQGKNTDARLTEVETDLEQVKVALKDIRDKRKADSFSQKQVISQLDINTNEIKELNTIRQEYDKLKTTTDQILERLQQMERETEDLKKELRNTKRMSIDSPTGRKNSLLPYEERKLADVDKFTASGGQSTDADEEDHKSINFLWRIQGFKQHFTNFKTSPEYIHSIESETLYNKEFGLQFKIRLYFDWQSIRIYLHSYQCSPNCWHAREFTLIDQSERANKKHVTITDTPYFGEKPTKIITRACFVTRLFAHISLLEKKYDIYVRNDSILIKLRLIPLSVIYKSVASTDGILLWHIDDYSAKKQDEVNGLRQFLLSPLFYTAPQGYGVQVQIYLDGNGDSKGKYISIYVYFVMGEFDNSLPTPINGMIKFLLLDQSDSAYKQHVCREEQLKFEEGKLHGMHNFVLQSQAEEVNYLEDDTLLLKIQMEIYNDI